MQDATSIEIYERRLPSFWRRAGVAGFKAMQLLFDTKGYATDRALKIEDMLDRKIEFFLVHDINKDPEITDELRQKYFGVRKVTLNDINWENLNSILMPARVPNAVYRVNDALEGSDHNPAFSRNVGSAAIYTPRTVTVYENEERAKFAAKILRLITRDADRSRISASTIIAEEISDGVENLWVVSDNMNLQMNINIRRIFSHLFSKIKDEKKRHRLDKIAQQEVDARLVAEDRPWEAWSGVGAFLTLAGCAKMYSKLKDETGQLVLKNGKAVDDPADVRHIAYLPRQLEMRLTLGIPDSTLKTADGRPFEHASMREIRLRTLLGQRFYSLLTRGTYKASGELLIDDFRKLKGKTFEDGSPFGFVANLPATIIDIKGLPEDYIAKYLGIALAMVTVLPFVLVCVAGNKIHGIIKEQLNYDWLEDWLRPTVEKHTGILTQRDPFHKVWTRRQMQKNVPQIQSLPEPEEMSSVNWQNQVMSNRSWGQRFVDYMEKNKKLPSEALYINNSEIKQKIKEYYECAADYIYARKFNASELPEKEESAREALLNLRQAINEMPHYNGGLHNQILKQLVENLRSGLNDFVKEQMKGK